MAKSCKQPVNLPGARPSMKPWVLPWNLLYSRVPCEWWYWSLGTYVINKIVKMKCELTVSALPLLLFPFANLAPGGGKKGDSGSEVAHLLLLVIPLGNALVLVCFSAVLYCWIIPLTKENEHTFIYTLTMPCKTSLRTWLSSSSSTSDIIKLQMSLSLVALWVIPDISNLCKSVSDVNCLKWHSAFKNICWAGKVIMQMVHGSKVTQASD